MGSSARTTTRPGVKANRPEEREPPGPERESAVGTPGMVLRPARAGDLTQIVALERASFTDPWSRGSFEGLLSDRRVMFWVVEKPDGTIPAYVVAWFVADEGEIANLAVAPGERGKHFGSALLDGVVAAAQARGAASVYLEVRDSNGAARALYASRGFVEVGRRRNYYRKPVEDALVLRLSTTAV